jgi:hypothetical protein
MTELTEDQPAAVVLPADRHCANCGCAARMTRAGQYLAMTAVDPESFVVCRRNMPQASQVQGRAPRKHPQTGEDMRNAQGQRLYDSVAAVQIGYPATLPEAVCFDGWRPLGTLPGVRWGGERMIEAFRPIIEKALIQTGVSRKAAEEMGHAMLTGLLPPRDA